MPKPTIYTKASHCENLREAFLYAKTIAVHNECRVTLEFDGKTYHINKKTKYYQIL